MGSILVKLECLTNLHVGDGEVNYNIVDNEVERDPVTHYPTINSSGVKGALRSYFKGNDNEVKWFGSDSAANNNHVQGKLRFLSANMAAIPVRTKAGNNPYELVYTEVMKKQCEKLCNAFGIAGRNDSFDSYYNALIGDNARLYEENADVMEYNLMEDNPLPVIARNHLNNGTSTNLWYEEVVPHESIFYFIVNSEDMGALGSFKESINEKVIQFGADASIGYGLCMLQVKGESESIDG